MPRGRPGVKIFCINDFTTYPSIADAAQHYNIATSSISKQLKGERTTVGGFHFVKIPGDLSEEELKMIQREELKKIYNIG